MEEGGRLGVRGVASLAKCSGEDGQGFFRGVLGASFVDVFRDVDGRSAVYVDVHQVECGCVVAYKMGVVRFKELPCSHPSD